MTTGTVKWFNATKGFGFIAPDDGGNDVFVHISAVERAGMGSLNEGQKLSYEFEARQPARQDIGGKPPRHVTSADREIIRGCTGISRIGNAAATSIGARRPKPAGFFASGRRDYCSRSSRSRCRSSVSRHAVR